MPSKTKIYGKEARELLGQAYVEPDPDAKMALERQARELSEVARKELEKEAFQARSAWVPDWFHALDMSLRHKLICGRVLSFQRANTDFHMSLQTMADTLGMDRKNLKRELSKLVDAGWLERYSNGDRVPASYVFNVAWAYQVALDNGWTSSHTKLEATKTKGCR